jgi:hypothetical protein
MDARAHHSGRARAGAARPKFARPTDGLTPSLPSLCPRDAPGIGRQPGRRPVAGLPPDPPGESPAEPEAAAFSSGAGQPAGAAHAALGAGRAAVPGSNGRPPEPHVRLPFEQALGADLSGVRVHDDPAAHEFAHGIGARGDARLAHLFVPQ